MHRVPQASIVPHLTYFVFSSHKVYAKHTALCVVLVLTISKESNFQLSKKIYSLLVAIKFLGCVYFMLICCINRLEVEAGSYV